MFGAFRNKTTRSRMRAGWSVQMDRAMIVVQDNRGCTRRIARRELHRAVMVTTGLWLRRPNIVILLYSHDPDPVAFFPLSARGCKRFLVWLRSEAGFNAQELERALASRRGGRFVIFETHHHARPVRLDSPLLPSGVTELIEAARPAPGPGPCPCPCPVVR